MPWSLTGVAPDSTVSDQTILDQLKLYGDNDQIIFQPNGTGKKLTITAANPTSDETITLPDPGSDDSFTFVGATQNLSNKTLTNPVISGTMDCANITTSSAVTITSSNSAIVLTSNNPVSIAQGINLGNSSGTLNNYLEGIFTPIISFGGSVVGIVYSLQTGKYTRIGRCIFITIDCTLSNKGSSTGNASISGLPFANASVGTSMIDIQFNFLTYTNIPKCLIPSSSSIIDLYTQSSGSALTRITDTGFANNTTFRLTGFYQI